MDTEFRDHVLQQTARGARIVNAMGLVVFPAFIGMDWTYFPDVFDALLPKRLIITAVLACLGGLQVVLRIRGLDARASRWMLGAVTATVCLGMDWMLPLIGFTEGITVFGGYLLVMLALIAIAPMPTWAMACVLAAIAVQFNVAVAWMIPHAPSRYMGDANAFLFSTVLIGAAISRTNWRLMQDEFTARRRAQALLLNILPADVAQELQERGRVRARHIDACTILFSDFVGFTGVSQRVRPGALVAALDQAFQRFDAVSARYQVEKLKTIGDAYMCAASVIAPQPDHLVRMVLMGLEMQAELAELRAPDGTRWRMRLGVYSGPVVAGVIGTQKFTYDLWGDTVNLAARMESSGLPGGLTLTTDAFHTLPPWFESVDRGVVAIKGAGEQRLTTITGLRAEYARDPAGLRPIEGLLEWARATRSVAA